MSRALAILALILLILGLGATSYLWPTYLSDANTFLKGFVNQELLSLLGVVVTITLASSASLHLELNRLENETGEPFSEARWATKAYARLLIGLFVAAVALVILKPIFAKTDILQAGFNSVAIVIIVLNVLSMADLVLAVFDIPPDKRLKK